MLNAFLVIMASMLVFCSGLIVVLLGASISGSIVYFLWPVVMVPAFHAPELGWWQCVCLVWLTHLLIRPAVSVTNKTDKK